MATAVPPAPDSAVRRQLREFGDLAAFAGDTVRMLPTTGRYFSEILRHTAILTRGSTLFIAAMTAAIGFSATSYGYYFLKAAGAADYIGIVPGVTTPRVCIPMLFAYAFAAKVGCGFVGEIGAMKVSDELDAYESEGISVQRFVVGTRLAAALIYTPIATAVGAVAVTAGSYLNSVIVIKAVPPETFFRYNWGNQSVPDQLFALVMCMILAITITLVSCFYGIRSAGGPAGVGRSVARSLLVNLVLIHIILGLGVFAVYGTGLDLPIGG